MRSTQPEGIPDARPPKPLTNLPRRSFSAATGIARALTLDELAAAAHPLIDALGYTHTCFAYSDVHGTKLLIGGEDNEWLMNATRQDDMGDDILDRTRRETPDAFFFSDVLEGRHFSVAQREMTDERRASGLREGFVGARLRQGDEETWMLLFRHMPVVDPDVRAATHLLAAYYSAAARRLLDIKPPPAPFLTQRQREFLQWAGRGKSGNDIAAILSLSVHTVQDHVAAACEKLGVRTRVQAVAVALTLALIQA